MSMTNGFNTALVCIFFTNFKVFLDQVLVFQGFRAINKTFSRFLRAQIDLS